MKQFIFHFHMILSLFYALSISKMISERFLTWSSVNFKQKQFKSLYSIVTDILLKYLLAEVLSTQTKKKLRMTFFFILF